MAAANTPHLAPASASTGRGTVESLKGDCTGPASPFDAFETLKREIHRRYATRSATLRITVQLVSYGLLLGGGTWVAYATSHATVRVLATVVAVAGSLGFATSAHTASHGAFARRRWLNATLTYFGFAWVLGVSVSFWRHKHIRLHHKAPNIVGLDGDIDIAMPFSVLEPRRESATGALRTFHQVQVAALPLALFFNGFAVQKNGLRFLFGRLLSREGRTRESWADLAVLSSHVATWIVLPLALWGVRGLVVYALRIALMGYALFIAFAPAHFPAPALCGDLRCQDEDFVLRQTATTVNYRTGPIGDLLCGGVQYQIEHHLFPNVPHVFYPEVATLVREFCERQGYPYRTLGWARALWLSVLAFHRPKRVLGSLSGARAAPALRRDPEVTVTAARVKTGDGFDLAATVYGPRSAQGSNVAIVLCAVGADQGKYRSFSTFLADEQWTVVTFDYRGIGASYVAPDRRDGVAMTAWGERDVAAVIDWAQRELRPSRLVAIGHSLGGQLVALAPNANALSAVLAVSAQRGHWRLWRGPMRLALYLLWRVYIPLCARFLGYVPLFAGRHRLDANAARDWARWGLRDDYGDTEGRSLRHRFSSLRSPLLFLSFEDDRLFAPKAAVDELVDEFYTSAARIHCHVRSERLGLKLGHSGFFSASQCPRSWWRESSEWLRRVQCPAGDEASVVRVEPDIHTLLAGVRNAGA